MNERLTPFAFVIEVDETMFLERVWWAPDVETALDFALKWSARVFPKQNVLVRIDVVSCGSTSSLTESATS